MLPIQALRMRNAGGGGPPPVNPDALSIYNKIVEWWEGNGTENLGANTGTEPGLHAGIDGYFLSFDAQQTPIASGLDVCLYSNAAGEIAIADDPALTQTGDLSTMCWFMRGPCTNVAPVLLWKSTGDDYSYHTNYGLYLYSPGGYVPVFLITRADNAYIQLIGTTPTVEGVPSLVIGNRTGSTIELFLNNSSEGSLGGSTSQKTGSTNGLYTGVMQTEGANRRYIGYIGSRAVFNDALTSDERAYLWNGGNGITYAALKAAAGF